jgi:ribosomal protein S24E
MSQRLKDELKELKLLSQEELLDKKNDILIDRAKINADLMRAEQSGIEDKEWYTSASYAHSVKGVIICAIDSELSKRKKKKSFATIFEEQAKIHLVESTYNFIRNKAKEIYDEMG